MMGSSKTKEEKANIKAAKEAQKMRLAQERQMQLHTKVFLRQMQKEAQASAKMMRAAGGPLTSSAARKHVKQQQRDLPKSLRMDKYEYKARVKATKAFVTKERREVRRENYKAQGVKPVLGSYRAGAAAVALKTGRRRGWNALTRPRGRRGRFL
jgi:predicted PP-loop superfamily ATPase